MQTFQRDYRLVQVSSVLSGYVEKMVETEEINQFIAKVSDETKSEYYEQVEQKLERLQEIVKQLKASREELNKLVVRNDTEWKKWFLLVVFGFVAAISGLYAVLK